MAKKGQKQRIINEELIQKIVDEKKKGKTCIGCPYADSCPRHRQNGAGCGNMEQHDMNIR